MKEGDTLFIPCSETSSGWWCLFKIRLSNRFPTRSPLSPERKSEVQSIKVTDWAISEIDIGVEFVIAQFFQSINVEF